MLPAKGYICCVTSGREIIDVWTILTVRVLEGYKFLAPKVSYNSLMKITPFIALSGRKERKKKKKGKKVYKMQSHQGISLQFSLATEAIGSRALLPKPTN